MTRRLIGILAFLLFCALPATVSAQNVSGKANKNLETLSFDASGNLKTGGAGSSSPTNVRVQDGASANTALVSTWGGSDGVATNAGNGLFGNAMNYLFNGSTIDRLRSIAGATAAGLGVAAVAPVPTSSANAAIAPTSTSAAASSRVFKASAGNLYSMELVPGAVSGFLMLFDATSAPVDGAVTPLKCYNVTAGQTLAMAFPTPIRFGTGITAVFSSGADCYTKTAQNANFISGDVQ